MINLGIIGLGKWSNVLTKASQKSSEIKIISAYSRSKETRDKYTSQYNIPSVSSVDDLLRNQDVKGIILTVPNELHFEYAKLCGEYGKHIYIEKPITNNLSEAFELKTICDKLGVKVFVGHVAKLLTGIQIMHKEILNGKLGDICLIEGNFSNERALSLTPENWRWHQLKAPGGSLSQIAIHQLDVFRFLGGEISDVSALSSKKSPVGAEVEDQWVINILFKNGSLGSLVSSWTSPGIFEVRVIGTKGLMHYKMDQTKWGDPELIHENASLIFQKIGSSFNEAIKYDLKPENMYRTELELFVQMIKGVNQEFFDARYGIEILSLVEACRASAQNKSIRINLNSFLSKIREKNDIT